MWGQVWVTMNTILAVRIIPTRVGTSCQDFMMILSGGDHPHACGDKPLISIYLLYVTGSSPRVWGQELSLTCISPIVRIIPTRVGTSLFLYVFLPSSRDHPHACGDKAIDNNTIALTKGSSPRVWGQAMTVEKAFLNCRIIPTRVGTSLRLRMPFST